ncbi:hypothetical protein [Streptomyces sp. B6B3]|uniref:hypothetical protein n=1 Tax=Streptomyces sp. B6B3 TaxID=3153570 RepID=UPI00325DF1F9
MSTKHLTRQQLVDANAQLRRELSELRRAHDELVAAARTTVVQHFDGESSPLGVLIDTLDQLGKLPEYAPQLTDLALIALDQNDDEDLDEVLAVAIGWRLA